KVASAQGVKEQRDWVMANKQLWAGLAEGGTAGHGAAMEMQVTSGNLTVNNYREGIFPDAKMIDCELIKIGMEGCFACPVRCKKVLESKGTYAVDPAYGGPEYETEGALGTNCGISDITAVARGSELCNANSLDTISTGMTISFAMECFENGLLTTEDTGGIELRFGNANAMLETIELIAKREGIGNLLAEGATRAAQKIGKGAEKFSMEVKGVGVPMHEPRLKHALGVGYMVNPHGADHCLNLHDTMLSIEGPQLDRIRPVMGIIDPIPLDDYGPLKVALLKVTQLDRMLRDSLVLCSMIPFDGPRLAAVTAAVTGWDTSIAEQLRVAERILTMFRLINIREGLTAEDDELPERFYEPKSGALADKPLDHKKMIEARNYYYTLMGWDSKTGIPLEEKVEELLIT
ncbi:MAG: aldehyde ferredoxin oxidoreductase C-terminal domain-containing protein, partial [Dehalococcoidales bacterium]|nr:aldehyde ferredoxin oxidoreductase C-terminal domain-containing protein [Dehalococcoidales bacterium]